MSTLIDRLMLPVRPRPVAGFAPAPRTIVPGLWRIDRKLRMPGGVRLPASATVLRLPDGALLVHAPVPIDDRAERELRALGRVAAVVAPNSFHHLYVADFVRRFADATLYLAPGLRERIAALPPGVVVADRAPDAWQGDVEPLPFGPLHGFAELALLHRSTATLVLADLAFHVREYESAIDRFAWRLFGVPRGFGPSRTGRLTLLRDAKAARPYLQKMLERSFERIVVAHGDPLEAGARQEFRRAFRAYLDAA